MGISLSEPLMVHLDPSWILTVFFGILLTNILPTGYPVLCTTPEGAFIHNTISNAVVSL